MSRTARSFAYHPDTRAAFCTVSPIPLLNRVTGPQRLAAEELLKGPLYRNGDCFQRQGGTRVVRVQTVRGLLDLRLACFDPERKAVLASNRLIEAERMARPARTHAAMPAGARKEEQRCATR